MSTRLILPPFAVLSDAAAALIEAHQGNKARQNAINKALWHLAHEIEIIPTTGGFLMPSGTRAGVIHRISTANGCQCEAGAKQTPCWHAAAIDVVEQAQMRAIPMAVRMSAAKAEHYRKAMAEIDELFA